MNLYYYSFRQKKLSFFLGMGGFFVAALLFVPEISYAAEPSMLGKAWDFVTDGASSLLFTLLEPIANFIFWVAGLFVVVMGKLLDMGIAMTISSSLYQNLQVINVGWTTVRDFSNMFFIFALLYIAIKTILGLAGSSTKKWVANLIIAAILINFSLFATKVVIDAGNVLAMGFWEKMTIVGKPDPSAAENLMQGLKLQTNFDLKDKDGKPTDSSAQTRTLTYLGGALVMLIAGFVFLSGAIMMIVRTVTLILLMIASPFAFLSFALPGGGSYANKWLSKLIGNAFVAPAFLGMLYLDIIIINGLDLQKLTNSNGAKFGGVFSGDVGSFPIIYNFLVVIILLLASLTVASSVSGGAGEQGSRLAKKYLGYGAGATFAGAAMVGRQGGGWLGKRVSENKKLQEMAANKDSRISRFAGNLGLASGEKMKKGTWDARNAGANKLLGLGGVNAGAGSKKNYGETGQVLSSLTKGYRGTAKEKELIDAAKARYAADPAAQKMYLGDRGVDLAAKRNKDVKTELDRGEKTQSVKDEFKKEHARYEAATKDSSMGTAELITIEKDVAKKMKELLGQLSGKESADLLTQDHLKMAPVISALRREDLTALTLKSTELTPETISAITAGVAQNGTDSAKNYMKSQTKVSGPFSYDAPASLATLTTDYDNQKTALGKDSDAFKLYAVKQKEEVERTLGMMGSAEEISQLSNDLIIHEAVVSNYGTKVIGELRTKLKNTDAALAAKFEENLQKYNTEAQTRTADSQQNARTAAAARSAPQSRVIPPTAPTI